MGLRGWRIAALAALLGHPIAMRVPAQQPDSIEIPHLSRSPRFEDFSDESEGAPGVRVAEFRQREPGDGKPVSQETAAYLWHDRRNIYVVFVCKDDPAKVRAHMSKREDLGDDDRVSVFLATYRGGSNAYVFTANPLGIQADSVHTEGRGADGRFDTLWYSRGRLVHDGYVVWMAIPFKSLRFAAAKSQTWGVALSRSISRNNERAFFPHITRRKNNFVQQMARLDGLQDISPGRNIQVNPYGNLLAGRVLEPGPAAFVNHRDARAGLDSKIILRDSLALDLTLNPDFSQVESDDPQVTVNRRYEVRFPEKRPFFLENASYFETPINLFFSRRVADPEFGMRLTGKLGSWSLGALAVDDRAPGRLVSSGDPLSGRHAVFGVGRIQRDIGKESRIGALVTSYDFGPSSNRVASIDARLKLSPTWFFAGQAARSYDRQRNGAKLEGPAYSAELTHASRNFTYAGRYLDFSPDFRSRPGFIPRVDVRQLSQYAGYYLWPESSLVLSLGPSVSAAANRDRKGTLQDWYVNADFGIDFKGPTGFKFARYEAFERYLGRGFRYAKNSSSFYAGWLRWLYLYGTYSQGGGINYNPYWELQPFLGNTTDASFGLTLRPATRMRVEQFYYYSRLGTRPGYLFRDRTSSVYNNHLFRSKVNYQFTRTLSARAILDHYSVLPDPTLIAQDKYKQLGGDVLFTYLVHPGTALYFGYNNRRENVAIEPGPPSVLRYGVAPIRFTGHQFFVKLSYLFRF